MARWLLAVVICVTSIARQAYPSSQTPSRVTRWSEDLNYLIARFELMHPNLYANISQAEFRAGADALRLTIPKATDVQMVFGIQELVARIRNTHTLCPPTIAFGNDVPFKDQFRYYPIAFYPFDDGLYVIATSEQYKPILGRKVVSFGRLATEQALHELSRFIGADNSVTPLANIPRFWLNDGQLLSYIGASDSPDSMMLTVEDGDGSSLDVAIRTDPNYATAASRMVSLTGASTNPPPLYRRNPAANYWFEYLPEQHALYVQLRLMNDMGDEPFPQFCRRLFDTLDEKKAEKLIVDVRGCPGGDHIELPLLKGILARPEIDREDRLFLIIGRVTGSAAQHLTSVFKHYTNATLLGEATASKPNQYGAMQQFTLPNSRLEISCATRLFQDAGPSDYSMSGVPDVFVRRLSRDARVNRDPVLERVFDYESLRRMRGELRAQLSRAYSEGGLEELKRAYASVKDRYIAEGFNMEVLLYQDFDSVMVRLMRSEDDYVGYLKFLRVELPNSIAVCYDLGYWMMKRGDREEAVRLFEGCLSLNPEHHHARMWLGLMDLEHRRQTGARDRGR